MYLKQIIIDGFKSYATRTVVNDFDQSFNAITGLNGSGKSNVLDSICFVLGITNLSQVRASSLSELVYKAGQAGVTKATVTLVFNNQDKSSAPVGYEQPDEITVARQIVIGGRNKYQINGSTTQPGRVQNLFHSVGLNVNNPHFLIMQGRITKVINMKPPELLSMIEEAAGTKMYENKKEAALKTIEKKERKVDEINSLLEEKINPSLQRLERERKHYLEWNQNNNDLQYLKRFGIAYTYYNATTFLRRNSGEGSELYSRVSEIQDSLSDLRAFHKDAKTSLDQLISERSKQLDTGNLEEQQSEVDELSKKIVKMRSVWTNQKDALETEIVAVKSVEDSLSTLTTKRDDLQQQLSKAHSDIDPAEKKLEQAKTDMEAAETAMLTGASQGASQGSGAGSLVDQLETSRRAVSLAQTQIQSLELEKKHIGADLTVKAGQMAQDREQVRTLEAQKRAAEKAIADAKIAVHELDFDEGGAQEVGRKMTEEKQQVAVLRERVEQLSARLGSCHFQYSDPYPNFDHRKVYGLVARLVRVKDPKLTTAIEVVAGGRLYQVVVDNDNTAGDLLKKGRLVRRVTILPLNKISHQCLDNSKLRRAKQIESSTELALSFVGYDHEVSNAIEHVFGRTLICPNMDAAKRVTFDDRVRARTVTLEGDIYDPSGTASGGSSTRKGGSVLSLLGDLKDAESERDIHTANLQRLSAQMEAINEKGRQYRQFHAQLQIRQDEAILLAKRLEETATGRLMADVEGLRTRLEQEIPQALSKARETLSEESKKADELEKAMENSDTAKKRAEQEAEAAIEKVRAAYSEASCNLQKAKDHHSSVAVEVEAADEEIKRLQSQLEDTMKPSVAKLETEVLRVEHRVTEARNNFEESEAKLKEERDQLTASSKAITRAKKDCEDLSEKIESLTLEKAKLDSKVREADRGKAGAQKLVADLDKKLAWIEQEKEMFGQEGTDYHFTDDKVSKNSKKLSTLEQRQEGLAKKINKKAMHMFETAKEEYRNLMKKKGIIEEDKCKIEQVIAGLDEKKMIAVEKTWRKVNGDFGNIFSDLLPGTSAKLEPPEGKSVEDGLEIRVAFGDVWKDSLSELSGGQRSLIALSLILAMLRFKPAPMYILDEVDAALDLSHTQNIGRMLRRHFSGSQFIVVSLKEGMFSNANVIFRTKFVDGVSTIKRTENSVARLTDKVTESGIGMSEVSADKENIENERRPVAGRGRKRRAIQ